MPAPSVEGVGAVSHGMDTPDLTEQLAMEWRADMTALHAPPEAAEIAFEDIVARHSEPHRRYHGLSHLTALFDLLERHAPDIAPGSAARLAVWWHDAIYDPKASDNEERSAHLARTTLQDLRTREALVDETAELILKTKRHWDSGRASAAGDAFLDADIAILGASPAVYDAYAAGVRREYGWASDELYRHGRSAFLQSALARERYFRTDGFEIAYGAQARENMANELKRLAGEE